MGLLCAVCGVASGCSDPIMNSGVAHPGGHRGNQSDAGQPGSGFVRELEGAREIDSPAPTLKQQADLPKEGATVALEPATEQPVGQSDGGRPREFSVEGPQEALRVNFDDLDLMKLLNMDPVTPDCIDKMPGWLKDLNGKTVRIRGFMKPSGVTEGIPQFVFVRSTDLCCFGPKGKVYHLIAVTLKKGLTTDYIELKPFDVVGKFRIEMIQLDEGLIFLLYHIDEAAIIRS